MNFVYFDFFAETDICVFTRLVLGDGLIGWEVVSDEETTKKKKKKCEEKNSNCDCHFKEESPSLK